MSQMFCFQCEQTAKGTGCTVGGVCGKTVDTANLQDNLTAALIYLARAVNASGGKSLADDVEAPLSAPEKSTCSSTGSFGVAGAIGADCTDCTDHTDSTIEAIINGLFITATNVNFDNGAIERQIEIINKERVKLTSQNRDCSCDDACDETGGYDMAQLWGDNEDVRSLKSLLLFGMRGMAAYAHHAAVLGKSDETVNSFFFKGLSALGENKSADELLSLTMELGSVNLRCMELLDEANTGAYGDPVPTKVGRSIDPGPFIVISGHDLYDLKLLLEQTEGKGVNIYTHGEMLPAHGYPELKKYPHLKGNFGTAWQNQQREFVDIPAPILFTSNCLMPVKQVYADRVFTTSVVSFPGVAHIGKSKDFTPVIDKALELGGYSNPKSMSVMNCGGDTLTDCGGSGNTLGSSDALTVGFARNTVLSVAGTVVDAVKAGAIRHFFLVGGCDGAKPGRNYYTDFVRQAPKDTVILTLACGKYRFNDLDIGEIGGLPRIMDMGQCNDAFSAIKVAVALSEAFNCSVNELPLTLVLSWYEQKAVAILLTLLSLDIKNIYIGPSLPAFVSPNILNALVEKFGLTPISTPEADLEKILG
ncbi:MAG: hydroxylamine reductase [Oscillospiraceae bacterium]|nr:hydroxylamine reductase [Oscillospiraceae bacterium]